jgi:nucleotide-binding universal stress UspA family protein
MRVLLAADDSSAARVAEAWIGRLRWAVPPQVDILCVARSRRLGSGLALQTYRYAVGDAVGSLRQADHMQALRIANSAGERLQSARFLTRAWARQGDPASEIGAMVRSEGPDLLVIGSAGRRGWFSRPDVVARVIRQVDAAVLATRAIDEANEPLPRRIASLVTGDDGGQIREWLRGAGWLDGAQMIAAAPEDLRDRTSRPDVVVTNRAPESVMLGSDFEKALEWASAVLVLRMAATDRRNHVVRLSAASDADT